MTGVGVGGCDVQNDDPLKINLEHNSMISITIGDDTLKCLIDTGATSNLISEKYYKTNVIFRQLRLLKPKFDHATTANGDSVKIVGFLNVPVQILGAQFMVPFYVTSKLYKSVILGSEFLMSQKVSIDFGKSKLRIHRKNQLRTCTEITVPPRSQSLCEVRIKNYLPSGVIGHCHGGRNIQNIGLVVANTISSSRMTDFGTKVTVMVMNPSEVPVTIFPRTKIGTFNIVEENNISVLTNFDKIEPNTNISHEVTNPQCSFSGQEVLDKINISSSSINLTQQQQLKALINSYADVFETAKSPRGFYDKVEHRIDIGNNPPVRSRPYRHSPRLQQTIREHVNKMLNDGIISESTSPFSSPVVMVTKKTGEYIFCIDFRRLNQITVRDNFPLPSISDTFNNLGMTKPAYFSTLDMASGYWQIGLDRDSKKKTAFITQDGLYEFNVFTFWTTQCTQYIPKNNA